MPFGASLRFVYDKIMITRRIHHALFGLLDLLLATAVVAQSNPVGLQNNVIFNDYSPLSRSAELVRRMLTPLEALRVAELAVRQGKVLREQSVDLSNEMFAVYVPPHAPPHGYSLLVFVPPSDRAVVPGEWLSILDHHDMIFVTAANSGNGANVLDRREPLALLAAQNIVNRYPVDPQRVYIGGFSGGSRVALRLALGYPDIFHGALLSAGSDPIGTAQTPLPVAQLFNQFQESTQLVYVTGERDEFHLAEDVVSKQSLEQWCVSLPVTETIPWKSHELPNAPSLNNALDAWSNPPVPTPTNLPAAWRESMGN